jgi:prephenate dehydrogenase
MKIFILGNCGRMGKFLTSLLMEKGHEVRGYDILQDQNEPDISELRESDVIILSIPQQAAHQFAMDHPDFTNMVEIGSVKTIMKDLVGRIICIHPLFGPLSSDLNGNRKILFIDDISPSGSINIIMEMFGSIGITPLGYDEHDRMMAELLVAPYIISLISPEIKHGKEFMTRSGNTMDQIRNISKLESPEVMKMSISLNPYSEEVLGKMRKSLESLMGGVQ